MWEEDSEVPTSADHVSALVPVIFTRYSHDASNFDSRSSHHPVMLIRRAWMICSLSGLSHALSWPLSKQKQAYVSSQYSQTAAQGGRDSSLPFHDGTLIDQAVQLMHL